MQANPIAVEKANLIAVALVWRSVGPFGACGCCIVGKSDFASGILNFESIFPNFPKYFFRKFSK